MNLVTPTITAQDLCFGYGTQVVLHAVNLEVRPREVLVVSGPNGSGKSTLIELLAGLHAPWSGTLQRHGAVALVVQRVRAAPSLPLTALDIVQMGTWRSSIPRSEAKMLAAKALDEVGLSGMEKRPFAALSGGQRQRVLLAQGLSQQTPTLLLDEPATGLDIESRSRMHQTLRQQANQGKALVMVTHDVEAINLADRVLRLKSAHSF